MAYSRNDNLRLQDVYCLAKYVKHEHTVYLSRHLQMQPMKTELGFPRGQCVLSVGLSAHYFVIFTLVFTLASLPPPGGKEDKVKSKLKAYENTVTYVEVNCY